MAKALGIGGVFFKSDDPAKLSAWYERTLGVPTRGESWAKFESRELPSGAYHVWCTFDRATDYLGPSAQQFMINLIVDDLDGALRQVTDAGGQPVGEIESFDYGRFGWFVDPDGNKVELWEPAK